jgi:prepilin-type N-terminal cleavage/methylation domain-containing protein
MKKNILKRKKLGFTMIELLVTATIIAVLSAIGLVSFRSANMKARNGKRMADIQQVRASLEIYRSDYPTYPLGTVVGDLTNIAGLSDYLSSETIADPKSDMDYTYTPALDGSTYSICANMEPAPYTPECVYNP